MSRKFLKALLLSATTFCLLFAFIGSVSAFGISPSTQRLELSPGETFDYQIRIRPTADHEKNINLNYSIEQVGVDFDEEGNRIFLEGEDMEKAPPYSVDSWLTFNKFSETSSTEDGVVFTGTLKVPSDTKPGTYYTAIITRAKQEKLNEGSVGASLDARAIANIAITIPGEVNENAEIINFSLDEKKIKQGDFVFITEVQSDSDLVIIPTGEITVYDQSKAQVAGIVLKTKTLADGTEIFESEKDGIILNPGGLSVSPNGKKTLETPWTNKNIKPGNYTAKLDMFYGLNGATSKELQFEITEDITIKLTPESGVNSSLPIAFSGIINNRGASGLSASVDFEIKDIFGRTVFSKNYPQLLIKSGGEFEVSNLQWDEGFALGSYTATLTMNYGATGNTLTAKAQFVVMNWWQIIIVALIVLGILILIVKGVVGYRKMKKKLDKLENSK